MNEREAYERDIKYLGEYAGSETTGPRATFVVAEILLDIRDQNERIIALLQNIQQHT